jgi:hypothetical protein
LAFLSNLSPQSPTIDFIAAKTCIAVASRNGARTGVDQIVTSDPRAIALRQRDHLLDVEISLGRG